MIHLFSTGHIAQYTRVYFDYSDIFTNRLHVYIIRAIKNNEPPHRSPVQPHRVERLERAMGQMIKKGDTK